MKHQFCHKIKYPPHMAQARDWVQILQHYSSGEESDEHDSLNVLSVQRNAHRISELIHATIPGLDVSQIRTPPMGMNHATVIRDELAESVRNCVDATHLDPRRSTSRGVEAESNVPRRTEGDEDEPRTGEPVTNSGPLDEVQDPVV